MSADMEKGSTQNIENVDSPSEKRDEINIDDDEEYSYEEQRKIIHRVDRRLVLICGLAYCISLMDRTNVSVAAISIMVLVFFVTYVVFQPLATAVIRKIGPRIFISSVVLSWGAVMIMKFSSAIRCFTSSVPLLEHFQVYHFPFRRATLAFHLTKRLGILAFGFSQMKGLQGHAAWSWIFIMQGVECAFIIRRLNRDRADANPEPFSLKKFLSPALDPKIWGFGLIFFSLTTVTYAIAYFLPIILRENMGFSVAAAQCLGAPPYIAAGLLMWATSWVGDKYRIRGPILALNSIITLIGLPIMGFAKDPAVRFFGVFVTVAGANANIPASLAYQANNIRGQWMRALASATLVGLGGVGGIAGSLVFRRQDAPAYIPGIWAAIAYGPSTLRDRYAGEAH
ncbi:conserved hypothetical protein [Aspergillus terreus NIH2624]|uniref:Major facilitator superfamily (MFS) profile domain-containing protein n=1 Tax=Aspergillus terreus (strain NIH 2624 / FGSC A1156) TaxID=341663 RepID=Q0CRY3_ASPTN|nr:uncharacterized protein ATEG_03551 [Aspergillus terreus NIH2624]EAU36825.1 conserved hypothetical protein [Aspergillus terreus NIH2624]